MTSSHSGQFMQLYYTCSFKPYVFPITDAFYFIFGGMEHHLLLDLLGSTEAVVQQLEIGEKARFTISRKAMMMMMMMMMMILGPEKKQLYESVGSW